MRFVDGLKDLFKRKLFLVIIILYITSMVLFIISYSIVDNFIYSAFVIIFMLILAIYTFIIFTISLFYPVEKMGIAVFIITALLTIPITYLFFRIFIIFAYICIYANLFLTAFFAFKFSIDTSIDIDDFLQKKKGSNVTRTIQFISLLLVSLLLTIMAARFFKSFANTRVQTSGNAFYYLFIVELILVIVVFLRLIFMRKYAAYISLFYILIFLYVLYIILDLWIGWFYRDNAAYDVFSFFIDLLLFLYIIVSIIGRVDYIQNLLKIIRADSIALFVIVMKLIVQTNKIFQEIGLGMSILELAIQISFQALILFGFVIFITLVVGIYKIFKHQTK